MRIAFALFADAANLSQEGKLNILGVFDALQVGGFPAVHPRATLVVRFKGDVADVGRHTLGLSWRNPRGQELWGSQGEVEVGQPTVGGGELDFPLLAALDLPLDVAGEYAMVLSLDGADVESLRLMVRGPAVASPMAPAPRAGLVS